MSDDVDRRRFARFALGATAAGALPGSLSAAAGADDDAALPRDELVARLVRAGEAILAGAAPEVIAGYFDPEVFRFHGPNGFETDYQGLSRQFAAIRSAFADRTIRRGIIVVEGLTVACQTFIQGTFVDTFTLSPAGPLPPNGARVTWDLSNIFRFDRRGRIVEEWVRTDYRGFLKQLGAEGQ